MTHDYTHSSALWHVRMYVYVHALIFPWRILQ